MALTPSLKPRKPLEKSVLFSPELRKQTRIEVENGLHQFQLRVKWRQHCRLVWQHSPEEPQGLRQGQHPSHHQSAGSCRVLLMQRPAQGSRRGGLGVFRFPPPAAVLQPLSFMVGKQVFSPETPGKLLRRIP